MYEGHLVGSGLRGIEEEEEKERNKGKGKGERYDTGCSVSVFLHSDLTRR